MNFGELIKDLRSKKGISQRQLSMYSNISNTEISRLESGERKKPSPDLLRRLAPPLDTTYSELMVAAGYIDEPLDEKNSLPSGYEGFYDLSPEVVEKAKEMHDSDEDFFNTMHRITQRIPRRERAWLVNLAKNILKDFE